MSSPTRMLVPQHMLKDATEIAVNAAEAMLTGVQTVKRLSLVLCLIKPNEKVQTLIQHGIDEGANLACGGVGRPDGLDKVFL